MPAFFCFDLYELFPWLSKKTGASRPYGQYERTNANGNITAYNGMNFAYNAANRLSSIGGSASLSYVYDGFGQRIAKTDTAQRFLYYDQAGQLLENTDNTGNVASDTIYMNNIPVATFVPNGSTGTLSYIYVDRLFTPRVITNTAGTIGWSLTNNDPFGAPSAPNGNTIANDLRYPGQENEIATGHNHNGFRDYAPSLGRYLETDPIGLAGGQASTYAYAGSSPLTYFDLSGLQSQPNPVSDKPATATPVFTNETGGGAANLMNAYGEGSAHTNGTVQQQNAAMQTVDNGVKEQALDTNGINAASNMMPPTDTADLVGTLASDVVQFFCSFGNATLQQSPQNGGANK